MPYRVSANRAGTVRSADAPAPPAAHSHVRIGYLMEREWDDIKERRPSELSLTGHATADAAKSATSGLLIRPCLSTARWFPVSFVKSPRFEISIRRLAAAAAL
ncbi:hypothetical protein EVAR_28368_1 [Eumeta japonica]|uniref:Uncharacterized protein n=1 Tax=Eumeta variegata TaxID=151549 RepID=A0A4C1ZVG9_EUMVA|nr:hypothetical protein EVAR_28368_1 [Eumeta japonica]